MNARHHKIIPDTPVGSVVDVIPRQLLICKMYNWVGRGRQLELVGITRGFSAAAPRERETRCDSVIFVLGGF